MSYMLAPGIGIGIEEIPSVPIEEKIKTEVIERYNEEAQNVKGYSVTLKDVEGKSRKQYIKEARQTSMYLIKKYTKSTLAKTGSFFGNKDHATVYWSINTINNLRDTNQLLITSEAFEEANKIIKKYKKALDKIKIMAIKITRESAEIIFVNKKLVSVEAGEIVNIYDLDDDEIKALSNFLEASKKLLLRSVVVAP